MPAVDPFVTPSEAVARRRAVTETRAVLRKATEAWRAFSCPGSAECCQLATTGRPPWLWPSEWALLLEGLARARRPLPPARADGGCPFLDAAGRRCTVYEDRPFGCRTFFCHRVTGPSKPPADTTNALLELLAAANLAWRFDAAPRSLPDLHREATAPP
ncbi:MAG: YkgJ family cysteine cluster protein [Myxococcaceae bacterium]|jgi:Fe-S-cluster containining protein|nr:YkgJ family cysteine cluster protein [Myxococcaceae bacterium]MCA3014532.1 YkgJ family cysteine cluster protein [Myxococcaceae bacterium]